MKSCRHFRCIPGFDEPMPRFEIPPAQAPNPSAGVQIETRYGTRGPPPSSPFANNIKAIDSDGSTRRRHLLEPSRRARSTSTPTTRVVIAPDCKGDHCGSSVRTRRISAFIHSRLQCRGLSITPTRSYIVDSHHASCCSMPIGRNAGSASARTGSAFHAELLHASRSIRRGRQCNNPLFARRARRTTMSGRRLN